jgi:phenylpropionate dioxygenase-like ring-hydroxylating dioxygenase large terminal subunit
MIPNGWYMICPSNALAPGRRITERALGTSLQLERDPEGRIAVRDADGRERLGRQANEMILVWEGDLPPAFSIDAFPELSDAQWTSVKWTRSRTFATTVENIQRDIVDNFHLDPVHHIENPETRASADGYFLNAVSQGFVNLWRFGAPPGFAHLRFEGRLHGPGLLMYHSRITFWLKVEALVFNALMPIDEGHVCIHGGVMVRKSFLPGMAAFVQWRAMGSLLDDYERDSANWESREGRLAAPALTTEDEALFALYERWIHQFRPAASPRAAVLP